MRVTFAAAIGWLHALIAALQFLTRLPLPVRIDYTHQVFSRSVVFYPVAGLAIGLLLAAAGSIMEQWLPLLPAAAMLVGIWISLTGGLHLDGLMDTADGILSHRPREQMLEIMKDSRVGAMGVIVCVLLVLLKFSLVYTLFVQGDWIKAIPLLVAVPMWSRWFMVVAIYSWPYARSESGMGSFFRGVGRSHLFGSTLLVVILSGVILYQRIGNEVTGSWTLDTTAFIAGYAMLTLGLGTGLAVYVNRKLGGLTGDTYGALNECLEAVLLLAVTAYF